MIRETYKGRKLTARAVNGRDYGRVLLTVNGTPIYPPLGRDERAALDQLRREIDVIDAAPVDGNSWEAHWYAPGTYELCPKEIHAQAIGGQCQHLTCKRDRAASRAERTAKP
jgi:hypothetical protein